MMLVLITGIQRSTILHFLDSFPTRTNAFRTCLNPGGVWMQFLVRYRQVLNQEISIAVGMSFRLAEIKNKS